MFRPYETWVHGSTLDTALLIHKVQFTGKTYLRVRASLVNRHNGIFYEKATFRIARSDLPRWTLLIADEGRSK